MQNFINNNTFANNIIDIISSNNVQNFADTSAQQGKDFAKIMNNLDKKFSENNSNVTKLKDKINSNNDSVSKNKLNTEKQSTDNKNTVDNLDSKSAIKNTKEALEQESSTVLSADETIKEASKEINNLIENALDGQLNIENVNALRDALEQIQSKIENNEIVVSEETKQALKDVLNRLLTQNPEDLKVDALLKDFKQLMQDIQANTFKTDSQVKLEEENSNPTKALELNIDTQEENVELKNKNTDSEKLQLKNKSSETTVQASQNVEKAQDVENTDKVDIEQEILDEMDVKIEEVSSSSTSQNDSQGQSFSNAQDEVIKLQIENVDSDSNTPVTFAFDKSIKNISATNNQVKLEGLTKELNTNDILNQIGSKFEQLKDGSSTKITMTLRPNDLGRVTIELLSGANGITTNIIAQNSQVKELLDKNIDILKQQLAQQGVNVQNVQVKTVEQNAQTGLNNSFSDKNQNEQNYNQNQNNGKNNESSHEQKHKNYKYNQNNIIENIDFDNNSEKTTASINTLRGKVSYNL